MSSSLSSSASTTASAAASATTSASASIQVSPKLKVVGIILAIVSGCLIGSSFVFKKKGLLRSQAGAAAGEGVAYLKSPLWWLGMIMMIVGELCNFAAYAFVEALVVTPLGALSVVICAILSSLFLNEKLSLFGWLGCALCILGSTIIALNGPQEQSIGQIKEFQKLFLAPGFLVYAGVLIAFALSVIFYFGPKHGKTNMLWYISVCSMIGGISVSVTTGLGAAIVTTAYGDNQFKYWFIYFLMIFVAVTLITEVYYLNVALALFNTAMVTPTYYVIFSFCSMVTTVVLFQGLKASASQILTIVMAFLSICIGITILQMSKVDPENLTKLDRRSTMLLKAARSNTQGMDEKDLTAVEDPGMDALRGSFGAMGSIIRARTVKRMSMNSRASTVRSRHGAHPSAAEEGMSGSDLFPGMRRHQLYDRPMPPMPELFRSPTTMVSDVGSDRHSVASAATARNPTIKFDSKDLVHSYAAPGAAGGSSAPIHEFHTARGRNRAEGVANSTAATLGVGARYSNFLNMETPPAQEADFGRGSSILVTSPLEEALDPLGHQPFTADAAQDRFHPPAHDPYEGMPATTTHSTSYPSTTPGSSVDSVTELGLGVPAAYGSDEDVRVPEPSPRSKAKALFGQRQPSPRRYPGGHGDSTDDEESRRLFSKRNSGGLSEEDTSGSEASAARGGIRLVSPPAGKF